MTSPAEPREGAVGRKALGGQGYFPRARPDLLPLARGPLPSDGLLRGSQGTRCSPAGWDGAGAGQVEGRGVRPDSPALLPSLCRVADPGPAPDLERVARLEPRPGSLDRGFPQGRAGPRNLWTFQPVLARELGWGWGGRIGPRSIPAGAGRAGAFPAPLGRAPHIYAFSETSGLVPLAPQSPSSSLPSVECPEAGRGRDTGEAELSGAVQRSPPRPLPAPCPPPLAPAAAAYLATGAAGTCRVDTRQSHGALTEKCLPPAADGKPLAASGKKNVNRDHNKQ
ncbi:translation initiation factor IF-2-like [Tachyglossus aculeatus]|uniref:translation initiation factor IF-2-like n=1 Tax=Tachyglossus aculeatus TaxID=9261 RepID=UPI0018F3606A|nr:translation initiation factor IF-2-like [Tachyglossus aculeatus]